MIHVIDTHALLWYLEDSPRLGAQGRQLLVEPGARLVIPTIVLAEARWLEIKGRVRVSWNEILMAVEADDRFTIFPFSLDVLRQFPVHDALEMHDAIICATALTVRDLTGEEVKVVTRDAEIVRSGLVETVW